MTTDDGPLAILHHSATLYHAKTKIFITSNERLKKQGILFRPTMISLVGVYHAYHFYHAAVIDGQLNVFLNDQTGSRLEVWSTEDQMQETWKKLRMDYP